MKSFVLAILTCLGGLIFADSTSHAETAYLQVKAVSDTAVDSRMPDLVRRGTKVDANAPQLRLDATVFTQAGAQFQANIEWYVFGRIMEEAKLAGKKGGDFVLMQSSKEAVLAKPSPGSKTSFFAYRPGQIRNGARSEGWLVRIVAADGRLLDAKASGNPYLALARDQARLAAFVAAKEKANTAGENGEVDLPLEVMAQIKAEAEKNWPGNPEMQAYEIKNKVDAHKAAYRK